MSEINIRFRLNEEDLISYNKTVARQRGRLANIVFIIMLGYVLITAFAYDNISYPMIAAVIFLFAAFLLKPVLRKRSIKKAYKKFFALRTDTIYEFYNDHIVERNEGGETEIFFEHHFPLEAIKNVIETENQYLFFTSPIEAILIPKRAITPEDAEKMNNLILNVFSGKYQKRS